MLSSSSSLSGSKAPWRASLRKRLIARSVKTEPAMARARQARVGAPTALTCESTSAQTPDPEKRAVIMAPSLVLSCWLVGLVLLPNVAWVDGARPTLVTRSSLAVGRSGRLSRPTMAGERGGKGFGRNPEAEARIAKRLESLRSPEELRRMEEDRERDRMEQYIVDEGLNVMPEVVGDRMLKRMIFFLGVPLFGGIAAFVAFIVAARNFDTVIKPTTVAATTQAIFALGVVGITYGPLSASWDEDREGSLLGFEEVGKNLESLLQSLRGPPSM